MIWPGLLFNLCMGLLFAAYLLRGVRRFERRADLLMAQLDQRHEEEMGKWDVARNEIKASLRAKTDRMIAELEAAVSTPTVQPIYAIANIVLKPATLTATATSTLPSSDLIPSEDELKTLPRRARVAFVVRCAQRVLPLYGRYTWPSPRKDQTHLLALAVSGFESDEDRVQVEGLLNALELMHAATAQTALKSHTPALYAVQVVRCASLALQLRTAGSETLESEHIQFTFMAIEAAYRAAEEIGIISLIRRDYDVLRGLALSNAWTDDTPVPPSVFGPMWPDGPPADWPEAEKHTKEIVIEFGAPDEMTTSDAITMAKDFAAALCALDLAAGGRGLAVQPPLEITAPAPVPTGAPRG